MACLHGGERRKGEGEGLKEEDSQLVWYVYRYTEHTGWGKWALLCAYVRMCGKVFCCSFFIYLVLLSATGLSLLFLLPFFLYSYRVPRHILSPDFLAVAAVRRRIVAWLPDSVFFPSFSFSLKSDCFECQFYDVSSFQAARSRGDWLAGWQAD